MTAEPYWTPSPDCRACGKESWAGSYLCQRCRKLVGRIEIRKNADGTSRVVDKQARLRAMKHQFDPAIDAYLCHFTNVPLVLTPGSRRSAEWTHLTAGDESSVVLASKIVNRMQSDLTEAEFELLVKALAVRFSGGEFDENAFPLDR